MGVMKLRRSTHRNSCEFDVLVILVSSMSGEFDVWRFLHWVRWLVSSMSGEFDVWRFLHWVRCLVSSMSGEFDVRNTGIVRNPNSCESLIKHREAKSGSKSGMLTTIR